MPHPVLDRFALPAALALAVAAAAAGCGSIGRNEEAQSVINRRAIGMSIGEFFDRYGPPRTRAEQTDRSVVYGWESAVGPTPPGPESLDQRTCYLRVTATARGVIGEVVVVRDSPGRVSTSRCAEIFRAERVAPASDRDSGNRS